MATKFAQLPLDSTGTNIRLWAQFVEDVLIPVGGWEATSDVGQTLPSLLPAPTGTLDFQKLGFRIYKTTDEFPPVYMRIDYGTGRAFQYQPPPYPPSFWITIGSGSNGIGTITGVMLPILQSYLWTAAPGPYNSYGCADKGRCALLIASLAFSLERSKNEVGEDTAAGLLFNSSGTYGDSGGLHLGLGNSAYLITNSTQPQPPIDSGLNFYHTTNNPAPILMGQKGVGVVFHFKGTAQQPGLNWLVVNSNDMGSESQVYINIYGQTHLYQHIGTNQAPLVGIVAAQPFAQTSMVTDDQRRLLMRWE
jgi:hypothetical protein